MRKEEERINEIKKQYKEDNAEFLEAQQLLNDKQDEIDRLEEEENKRRNQGNAASIIPSAVSTGYASGGAVSGTDSESESEFQQKIKGKRIDQVFKWTPE